MSLLANHKITTIIFDMDGTLVDTAPDLAYALNILLQKYGRKTLAFEQIRSYCAAGSKGLLGLGFQIDTTDADYQQLRDEYLQVYHDNIVNESKLFPGINDLLDMLEANGIGWGVVTNKPEYLARIIMEHFNLSNRAACLVGGDTIPERKPNPEPLWHACKLIGCRSEECVVIGDAQRDIEAGKKAGMLTVAALYGYISAIETPSAWQADAYVGDSRELITLLA